MVIRNWIGIVATLVLLSFYQNCSKSEGSRDSASRPQLSGDGTVYTGLQGQMFERLDSLEPCSTMDLTGRPLANEMVLVKSDNAGEIRPFQVRTSCQDIIPNPIPKDEVRFDSVNGTLEFKNQAFQARVIASEFDSARASCPSGMSPRPNASRINEFANPLDWTRLQTNSSPGWFLFPAGLSVTPYGSIAGLTSYRILRNDPNNLQYWVQPQQMLTLKANTRYSFSFIAQAGSVDRALWFFYRNLSNNGGQNSPIDESAHVDFDFTQGKATVGWVQNITNVSATMTPFESGFLCTVYFTSSTTANQNPLTYIGVSPSTKGQQNGVVGDSIQATNAQLVPVNQFCQ